MKEVKDTKTNHQPWAAEVLVVRLPGKVKRALRRAARAERVSMNTVVIEALMRHLDVRLKDSPREHGRPHERKK